MFLKFFIVLSELEWYLTLSKLYYLSPFLLFFYSIFFWNSCSLEDYFHSANFEYTEYTDGEYTDKYLQDCKYTEKEGPNYSLGTIEEETEEETDCLTDSSQTPSRQSSFNKITQRPKMRSPDDTPPRRSASSGNTM